MTKRQAVMLVCLLWLRCAGSASGQEMAKRTEASGNFVVGTITAAPGTRASGFLEVAKGTDAGTRIPVTVIRGIKPGPVLALIADTHGYEYSPILAMQRFPAKVEPRELAGTIIVVHVANMPSFLGRTIYYSPVDGKNLNRVYPGKDDGTVSERKSTRLNSSHLVISYAVFCLKKKKKI